MTHSNKPKNQAQRTKTIFAFDMDDTLFREKTYWNTTGPEIIDGEGEKIKAQMAEAIKNGHEVWLVTANWSYTKDKLKNYFNPDPDNLLKNIKFYNSIDIENELHLAHGKNIVHREGKKAEFLKKKISKNAELANYEVNCVLFDDTQVQIDKCAEFSSDKIKIEGFRVDEYRALNPKNNRKAPAHNLSVELTNRVKAAGVVAGVAVPNEPAHVKKDDSVKSPHVINTYAFKASSVAAGRFHFFTASLADTLPAAIRKKYKGCSGDYLKTQILKDLEREIDGFTDITILNDFKQNLEQRPEYQILKTAQGLFSTITGKKTSSIEALENMIQQKEDHFKNPPAHVIGF